jgi:thiol-disulfide isomerase/thioredoxin
MKPAALLLVLALAATALANESAEQAWAQIQALQKGPGTPPSDAPEEVVRLARGHLLAQEKALASFLTRYPEDPRRYDAELEYTSVLSTLGASLSDRARVERSLQRLTALERSQTAPSRYRADAAFQRITTTMQTVNLAAAARPAETANARNTILESAQNFAARYPEDRRAARLLAEAATLLDDQPSRKRKVLEQATLLARDDATRQRIKDDLQRLELLGRATDLTFPTVQGGEFSLAAQRGRVVVLVFWAGWSPPSVAWLAEFAKFAARLPANRVTIATVSLDKKKDNAVQTLRKLGLSAWPTACSGTGWDDPLTRRLGINALPTVFIFDPQGNLRTLNARRDYEPLIRQLLAGRQP